MKGPRSRLSTTALGPWQAAAARGFRRSFEKFCTSMKCAGSQVLKIFLKVLNGEAVETRAAVCQTSERFPVQAFYDCARKVLIMIE
jgi:hypothetical protein